ncbi:glutamate racemase [Oceanobacter mangrovi]|uniref:glutamate racemase n=1 Tax=Oceanobacter mangrovi TaxID=2862510 RepID=UPI001FE41796|nr:glutamate racemase [Oceanobacter mangrovi]
MILIFDSGVGGLSIAKEIRSRLPKAELHYLMDSAYFPYGIRDDAVLQQRIVQLCQLACEQLPVKLLVVACNTASTLALTALRAVLPIPVVGVVPAIKPAALHSKSGHIGLLATPATVSRSYTNGLIDNFAAHCQVSRLGTTALVELAEQWLSQPEPDESSFRQQLEQQLSPWLATQPQLDTVVLGCTHFPVLRPLLEKLWPGIHWIDSGAAIARRVEHLLLQQEHSGNGGLFLYRTGNGPVPAGLQRYWQNGDPCCWPNANWLLALDASNP